MSQISTDRRFVRWMVSFAALALLAGACGDDSTEADDAAPATGTDASTDDSTGDGDDDPSGTDAPDTESTGADPDDETDTSETETTPGDDDEDAPADEQPADTSTTSTAAPTTTGGTETTTTLAAESGLPPVDERGENEAGVRIDLDETATLACARAEFARESLRLSMLEDALEETAAAADRAEPSAVVELAELVPEMRAAQTAGEVEAVIDEVLAICVERGHQI